MRESGPLPTASLTATPRGHHYGRLPSPASEEDDENFCEIALDEELIDAGDSASAHPQSDFPGSLPHDGASFPRTIPENPADTPSAPSAMSVEHSDHTSFVIPGVSTHRTEFAALSHTLDTAKVTQQEESHEREPDKTAPLHTTISPPHPRETPMLDSKLFSRLKHFVGEGAKPPIDSAIRHRLSMTPSSSLVEQPGVPNEDQGDTDVARRLAQLQRVVRELAATVSRNRDESQARHRELKMPPRQRTIIIERSGGSTTPPAFWERSRLGRFYLRTGR
jgi:hypothetical protein